MQLLSSGLCLVHRAGVHRASVVGWSLSAWCLSENPSHGRVAAQLCKDPSVPLCYDTPSLEGIDGHFACFGISWSLCLEFDTSALQWLHLR